MQGMKDLFRSTKSSGFHIYIVQTQTTSRPHTLSKDHYFGGGERFESIRRNWIYGSRSICLCFLCEE